MKNVSNLLEKNVKRKKEKRKKKFKIPFCLFSEKFFV